MEHEKIIDKIKKCLALSNSDNPHEAAAALRQAQKLMEMHNLTELDISLSDVQECSAKAPSEGKIDSPPLRIDSEQMTCLLGIITERLDIIEASYLHVANARAIRAQQIQGV